MPASPTQNLSSSWAGATTRVWLPSGEHIDTKCASVGLGIHTRYTGGHSQARPVSPRDGRVKSGGFPEEGAFGLAPIGRRDESTAGRPARAQHTMDTDRSMGGGWGEAGASGKRQEWAGVVCEVQAGRKALVGPRSQALSVPCPCSPAVQGVGQGGGLPGWCRQEAGWAVPQRFQLQTKHEGCLLASAATGPHE